MGILKLFSKVDVDTFAKDLAQAISKRYPPSLDTAKARKISVNRVTKVLEDAMDKAAEFSHEKKLGMLGKAQLGNTFKWELKELGYSEKFVDVATEALIIYVTRKKTPNTQADDAKTP